MQRQIALSMFPEGLAPNSLTTHVIHREKALPHCLLATWATKTPHIHTCNPKTTTECPKISRLSTELANSTQNSNKCRTNKNNCTLNDLTGFSYQFAPHYNFPNTHVIHGNRASPHCLSTTWATKNTILIQMCKSKTRRAPLRYAQKVPLL